MENSDGRSADCVRVAVNIRPLITSELLLGCTDCISVVPGEPQVQIGTHTFTYDYVYGSTGLSSYMIYDDCVAPLVDALFNGYNATVLAYGQTGSGKTYTMGTNYNGEGSSDGVIPRVLESIFERVKETKDSMEFLIRVSFIEIFKEEVFDLLDPNTSRGDATSATKPVVPGRVPIQIRESVNGGITLSGVTEAEVKTKEEMASYLSSGSLSRATGSTNMNSQSSRSHAIFTITMEQKNGDDILCAKLHLVDLAGSERAKRTGADGMRLKEGIHINKGLLALGNVISALGDEKKRKEGGHVPYRDSKLTRLLQDSLGGNSKTVMIACVSPGDNNIEETLNTLKYANRARNIQNKAIINRDPAAAQTQEMRNQIEQLQAELLFYRGEGVGPFEELQILKHKTSLLEASNAELQQELTRRRVSCESLQQRALEAQVERDQLIMKIEAIRNGKSLDKIDSNSNQDYNLVKAYLSKIQYLEGELRRLKTSNTTNSRHFVNCVDSEDDEPLSSDSHAKAMDLPDESEDDEKELEHTSLQEQMDKELKELDKKLEQKEAEMKLYNNSDASVLRHHYERKLLEMEHEKKILQQEIEQLKYNLANISSNSDDGAEKIKQDYLLKLNALEMQVAELKRKQEDQAMLFKQKQRSDEAAKRLYDEIQRIKAQKESEQFRLWKATREKEVLQLRKEGRRNKYEMHKLLALNQRQKLVLQRKTEEASMATKRLKDLLESRKASSRESTSVGGGNASGIQALMKAIEHELEVAVRVHEVRSEYERQMEEYVTFRRNRMASEMGKLKEEVETMNRYDTSDGSVLMSPGGKNSRIFALENMLSTSSSSLVSMASQLSEAEEQERVFNGKGRWNQVRSIADAKNLMNFLFNIASSSRCLVREKEIICREKDTEIRDLKEKVVRLNYAVRQLEMIKAQLTRQLESQSEILKRYRGSMGEEEYASMDLHKPENRHSTHQQEDMYISGAESEYFDDTETTDDEWFEPGDIENKRKTISRCSSFNLSEHDDKEYSRDKPGVTSGEVTAASNICCSCSKTSSCNTAKCKCKTTRNSCKNSCSCLATKCANRASISNESQESTHLGSVETDKDRLLVTQGAELLRGALVDALAAIVQQPTKALTDIGNTLAKPKAQKGSQKKKLPKSTTIVVSNPSSSLQPENSGPPKSKKQSDDIFEPKALTVSIPPRLLPSKPENAASAPRVEGTTLDPENSPLKLRAARRAASSNDADLQFWDRNTNKFD
ncbi:hypothetical protein PIB30_049597 [Stylosanthes scabra]|uniref:Kinesin motor domain-containing protein n=1 Tax=Stylosanthes scabra TaxID=79078 RepID=A0ABU6VJD7_9FABA|nr:hypothetical protein [Stylosanthes scabra]